MFEIGGTRGRAAVLGVACAFVCGCGSSTLATSTADAGADASITAPVAATRTLGRPSLMEAYVASRQAEGASDPTYHLVRDRDRLRARNGAIGVNAGFDVHGIEVSHVAEGWRVRVDTRAVRCGDRRVDVSAPTVSPSGGAPNRARLDRRMGDLAIEEWATNGPLGIEQGYTIGRDPCGGEELAIEVELEGLTPSLEGPTVSLRDAHGTVRAYYGQLFASDANDHAVPAQLAVRDGHVELRVQTRDAAWPVTIDPLIWGQQAKLVEPSPAVGDNFATSMAISGNLAVVGAPNLIQPDRVTFTSTSKVGGAFVYAFNGSIWSYQTTLNPAVDCEYFPRDSLTPQRVGQSVAVSGSVLGLSAPGNTGNAGGGGAPTGAPLPALFSYTIAGGGVSGCKFILVGAVAGSSFTSIAFMSLATDGTNLFTAFGDGSHTPVLAMLSPSASSSTSGWTTQPINLGGDPTTFAKQVLLGTSISAAPGLLLVGSPAQTGSALNPYSGYPPTYHPLYYPDSSQGVAYLYDTTVPGFSLKAGFGSSDSTGAQFGQSVALTSNYALVGAPGANAGQGAAYVFTPYPDPSSASISIWEPDAVSHLPARLTASDGVANDRFGMAVAAIPTSLVVGSQATVGSNPQQGAAYVFNQSGTTWTQTQKLTSNDGATGDLFGSSFAESNNTILVGAPNAAVSGSGQAGAAYVYRYGIATGSTCTLATDCLSGNCVSGVCCNQACAGACEACTIAKGASADGTCTLFAKGAAGSPACAPQVCDGVSGGCVPCTSDGSCSTGQYCGSEGGCHTQKAHGASCNTTAGVDCLVTGCAECGALGCVDGYCCDTPCNQACGACSTALGAPANGTCGPAKVGTGGHTCVAPSSCNGTSLLCPTLCGSDLDCVADHYCDHTGTCQVRKPQGSACNSTAGADCWAAGCRECTSGFCADGFCCDVACNGGCEACAAT
ncbi:MAG: FG-GAP repeat protein, partial [Polyangiales bacterium]